MKLYEDYKYELIRMVRNFLFQGGQLRKIDQDAVTVHCRSVGFKRTRGWTLKNTPILTKSAVVTSTNIVAANRTTQMRAIAAYYVN